jgi:hypothetical protein
MTTLTLTETLQELDERQNNGITVSLLWNRADDSLVVRVIDAGTDEQMFLQVAAAEAMDVFHHPYAHAAFRGIDYRLGARLEPALEAC